MTTVGKISGQNYVSLSRPKVSFRGDELSPEAPPKPEKHTGRNIGIGAVILGLAALGIWALRRGKGGEKAVEGAAQAVGDAAASGEKAAQKEVSGEAKAAKKAAVGETESDPGKATRGLFARRYTRADSTPKGKAKKNATPPTDDTQKATKSAFARRYTER